jgi:hypothetical protein
VKQFLASIFLTTMLAFGSLHAAKVQMPTAINVVIVQSPTYPQPASRSAIESEWLRSATTFAGFSYGLFRPVSTVLGPFTVSDAALTSCNRSVIKAQIVAQYGAALPAASKTMYVMPLSVIPGLDTSNTNSAGIVCDRFGSLVIGNEAWTVVKKFAWSLGGTLGLSRAYAEECNNYACIIVTPEGHTGDRYDVMATGAGLNSLERLRIGWLPAVNVTTVTSAGTYQLAALELPLDGQPRVLQIHRSAELGNWFVEVRQVVGGTLSVPLPSTIVTLHRAYGGASVTPLGIGPTVLEDVDPQSTTTHENVAYALSPGQTFVDWLTGISIKTLSILNSNSAVVEVLFGQPIPAPVQDRTTSLR